MLVSNAWLVMLPLAPGEGIFNNLNIKLDFYKTYPYIYMYQMKTSEEHIVKIAKALSDKSRVRILQEIAKRGRITCGDAVGIAVLSQPAVSHHIKVLVEAGLLDVEKNGRHHIISVNKKALDEFTALVSVSAKR